MRAQRGEGWSAREINRSFVLGGRSATEIIERLLSRCRSAEPFNPFAALDARGALACARDLDRRRGSGGALGALAAVPFSAKDLISTKGLRTAYASLTQKDNVPEADADAVAQLRQADAVLFAKTTTPEYGHKVLTDSRLHGVTRNPWDPQRTCGGSSGGAGVAVALGLGPIAVSTDGAGSGRVPAACCGVYGLKPTLGRVPHEQAVDQFGQLTHLGIMARHPSDLGYGLASMSRSHAEDPWSVAASHRPFSWPPPPPSQSTLAGQRVAVVRRMTGGYLHPDVESRLDAALGFLESRGASIRELDGRDIDWKLDTARLLLRSNQISRFARLLASRREDLDPSFVRTLEEGAAMDVATLRRAMLERTQAYRTITRLFDTADLLLTPTVAAPPPFVDQDQFGQLVVEGEARGDLRSAWYTYTIPFNLTGHPAISIPFGHSKDGLPIGIHFVAPWFAEDRLIALAETLDAETHASAIFPPGCPVDR